MPIRHGLRLACVGVRKVILSRRFPLSECAQRVVGLIELAPHGCERPPLGSLSATGPQRRLQAQIPERARVRGGWGCGRHHQFVGPQRDAVVFATGRTGEVQLG